MSIRSKIQALITAANTKTGESDTTLTDAVQTLLDGYGQGGGDPWELIADYTSDDVTTLFTVAISSEHQNHEVYKVLFQGVFTRSEYPHFGINSSITAYSNSGSKINLQMYICKNAENASSAMQNNIRTKYAIIPPNLSGGLTTPAPLQTVSIKSYYENSIPSGFNIKVWRLVE